MVPADDQLRRLTPRGCTSRSCWASSSAGRSEHGSHVTQVIGSGCFPGVSFSLLRPSRQWGRGFSGFLLALLPTLGGPCPHIPGPPNRGFTIAQQLHIPQTPPTDLDHRVIPLPTGDAPSVPVVLPTLSVGRAGKARQLKARTRTIGQVAVLDVAGLLGEVDENLDRAIQLALAEGPRGVVCDLSTLLEGIKPGAAEILATAGRHVRDWPAIPVVVACPDPQLREELHAHPLGRHLIVTGSTSSAISAVLAAPILIVKRLRLAPNPMAPRASRNFVARVLQDWQLDRVIPFASVVVSRLVAGSSLNAGTAIDLSVAWNAGALRLTVRDHGPARPSQRLSEPDLQGRGVTVAVATLSRTFGVLPTADGGKVVWAVLDAPQQRRSTSNRMRTANGSP